MAKTGKNGGTTQTEPQTAQKSSDTDLLESVKEDITSSITYARNHWTRWDMNWKAWNNTRTRVQYHGESDSFEPMTHRLVETLVANIYGGTPKWVYTPTRPEQQANAKVLNQIAASWWDKNKMDAKIIPFGRETKITGNAVIFAGWDGKCPEMIHKSIRDCILDYSVSDPDKARFAGYRRLELVDELKKEMRFDPNAGPKDPETGEVEGDWVPKYKIPDDVAMWSTESGDQTDKQLKEAYEGSTLPISERHKQAEVVTMYYRDQMIEVMNRDRIIFQQKTPFYKDAYTVEVQVEASDDDTQSTPGAEPGMVTKTIDVPAIEPFIPYLMDRDYVDNSLLLAKSSVDTILCEQEELNDSINQDNDNRKKIVDRVAYVDPNSAADQIPQLANRVAGAVFPVKPGDIDWEPVQDISQAGQRKQLDLRESMRETVGADEVVSGTQPEQKSTATEINAVTAGAGHRFQVAVNNLESGPFWKMGEIWWKFFQIFVTESDVIKITGNDGIEFVKYNPKDFWGEWDVRVELEATAKANQQLMATQAINMYELMKGDPNVDPQAALKWVLKTAFDKDEDEIETLLIQPAQPQAGPDGQPTAPTSGPMVAPPTTGAPSSATPMAPAGPKVIESADLVKLYLAAANDPGLQDQIVEQLGFSPTNENLAASKHVLETAKAIHSSQLAQEKQDASMAVPPPGAAPQAPAVAPQETANVGA